MVESDPVLGVTQEARDAANQEALAWEAAHPNLKKRQPATVRAKPSKP
jgi:hypothetical protein